MHQVVCPRSTAFGAPGQGSQGLFDRNVVALGLSGGLLEPIESTSIHLIQTGISKLMALLPDAGFSPVERDEYNRLTDVQLEQVRDFIILHYHANARQEGELWRRTREMAIPETLGRKLDLFRNRGRFFRYDDELFAESSWVAVMLGQGIMPAGWDPLADAIPLDQAAHTLDRLKTMFARAAEAMPPHEAWLARNAPARRTAA